MLLLLSSGERASAFQIATSCERRLKVVASIKSAAWRAGIARLNGLIAARSQRTCCCRFLDAVPLQLLVEVRACLHSDRRLEF